MVKTNRQDVTTDLQFADGKVLVAGLSNEEFGSQLRVIPFPFAAVDQGTSVEIFHGAHGKFETKSPVRTFAVFDVGGQPNVLAAYTCTPLVKIPVSELKPGNKVKGTKDRDSYLPASLSTDNQGQQIAQSLKWGGSSDFVSFARATALIIVPADSKKLEAGTLVQVLRLPM